jgi:hypothetical protein
MAVTPDITGKVLTRQALNSYGTTLTFNLPEHLAEQLREASKTLVIKHTKRPSMALLARLAMTQFIDGMGDPLIRERVRLRLDEMVTQVPQPRDPSQRRAARTGS